MRSYLFFILVLVAPLTAKIIEIKHFNEVVSFVQGGTLLILDIDDTLIVPKQTLGSDVWFLHRVKEHEKAGMSKNDAFLKALADWQAVRHLTEMQLVESGQEKMIEEMQNQGVMMMGLTTQGLALATRTLQHLQDVHIDLNKNAPSRQEHYFSNGHGVLYRQGILFTAGTNKGEALLKLFSIIDLHPSRVVFVNDKQTHLCDVEGAMEKNKIEFVGLRYAYCDERVASFDPEIAKIQWERSTFSHILSDRQAAELK